ncbi:hypothetical protein EFM23_14390 [Lactiplantibacillus plantarum]|nr:hypothetical protein [Lactiplantibacillus plantarum]
MKTPSWVDLGNIYRFPKAGLNFKEIGHLSKLDQNKISDFTLDLKSKRRGKGQKIIQQRSSKRKHKESKAELTQRIQKQLKDFAKHNPENKNDRPSY